MTKINENEEIVSFTDEEINSLTPEQAKKILSEIRTSKKIYRLSQYIKIAQIVTDIVVY